MATSGPKPKPVEIRKRDGSYRADRHGDGDQVLPQTQIEDLIEPPETLDPTAQEFWRLAVPMLHGVGLLSIIDRPALELMCTQYARAKQAGRVLAEQGHLVRGSTGQLTEHPEVRIEREATLQFMRLAEQYALTPVARTRLGLAELQRRSLEQEMHEHYGKPKLEPV